MMITSFNLLVNATSICLDIFIENSVRDGLTGLVFNTPGLTCYYHRELAVAPVQVSLVNMTVGTFTSGGFKEIDSTNMPGWYQLCVPNAAWVFGSGRVSVQLKGAAVMASSSNFLVRLEDSIANLLVSGVPCSSVLPGAIDSTSFAAGAINAAAIANGAIDAATFAPNAIDAAAIAPGAIDAAAFAPGSITASTFAAGAITAAACSADFVSNIFAYVLSGTKSVAKYLRIIGAALAGKSSGGGTATIIFRDLEDANDEITGTVDGNRNRTGVTYGP